MYIVLADNDNILLLYQHNLDHGTMDLNMDSLELFGGH